MTKQEIQNNIMRTVDTTRMISMPIKITTSTRDKVIITMTNQGIEMAMKKKNTQRIDITMEKVTNKVTISVLIIITEEVTTGILFATFSLWRINQAKKRTKSQRYNKRLARFKKCKLKRKIANQVILEV